MDYLIRLAQTHEDFRLAEIRSLAALHSIRLDIISYSANSPFLILRITSYPTSKFPSPTSAASALIARSVLSLGIYELWGVTAPDAEATYEALHADVTRRTNADVWARYRHASFKFSLDAYCGKRSPAEQTAIINGFRYFGFEGAIRMTDPECEWTVFEEWRLKRNPDHCRRGEGSCPSGEDIPEPAAAGAAADKSPRKPHRLFLGRLLSTSARHALGLKHDLKRRPYISTTSMDAVLALVSANLVLAGPGRLIYDPFVGTGGFLVAAAEFGAGVWGSDIDGRSFRGTGKGGEGKRMGGSGGEKKMMGKRKGVWRNFEEYGLLSLFGDCFTGDLVNTPLRRDRDDAGGGWLDGMIGDPPYGVREGLKVLGNREAKLDRTPLLIDGVLAHTLPGYIAPKKPYSFERMLDDVLALAADTLVVDGRLAIWMPSANEDDEVLEIPSHKDLELVECCVQRFYKWSRRLLVYRRRRAGEEGSVNGLGRDDEEVHKAANGKTASDLNPFRRRYFQGFQT